MQSHKNVWTLSFIAMVPFALSCGEGLREGDALTDQKQLASMASMFPVAGAANLYQRTNPETVVSGSLDPVLVPEAALCAGQQIQLTATGCVVDYGASCTGADGISGLFRGLRTYSLIGRWSTSPLGLDNSTLVGDAFFVGANATLTAPPADGVYYLFLGNNDGQFGDNTGSYAVTATWDSPDEVSISCPGELVVEATGPDGAFVTPAEATVSNSCGVTVSGPAAGIYPLGTTPVTYVATDVAGNSASCTTAVHVVDRDATPPSLTMCGMPQYTSSAQVKACGWATAMPGGATISTVLLTVDGGTPLALAPDVSGGFVFAWLDLEEGAHTITLTAIDVQGGATSHTQTVTVDRTAPTIRILAPAAGDVQTSLAVEIVSEVVDSSPTRVTTNWAQSTQVEPGTQVVRHTVQMAGPGSSGVLVQATDAAGNTSEQQFTVLVE